MDLKMVSPSWTMIVWQLILTAIVRYISATNPTVVISSDYIATVSLMCDTTRATANLTATGAELASDYQCKYIVEIQDWYVLNYN